MRFLISQAEMLAFGDAKIPSAIAPIGTVYLSPPSYERNSSEDLIGELEEEMFLFSQKGDIIVQGDYNARTGDIQETVLDDDNAFLNVPEDYESDEQPFRYRER